MKRKNIVLCSIAAVLVCAAVSFSALALNGVFTAPETPSDNTANDKTDKISALDDSAEIYEAVNSAKETTFIDEKAAAEKNFAIGGALTALTYKETTESTSNDEKQIYLDDRDNEYYFNTKGDFLGSAMNIYKVSELIGEAKKNAESVGITEEEAVAVAKKTIKEYFGEAAERVGLSDVVRDVNDGSYYVVFNQYLGNGGFIRGLYCYANILPDGSVFSCGMPNRTETENFDASLLDDFSEQEMREELGRKTTERYEKYKDSLKSFDIGEFALMELDGKYYVRCSVMSELESSNGDSYCDGGQTYYWEVPNA